MNLREYLKWARENKKAIGHFNASTLDGIWAIADAAHELKLPVVIGLSEGERDYIGVNEAVSIIKSIRQNRDQDIFLNADHTYSFERVKEAIDAGFDSVIFDGAELSMEENIKVAKECVEYARKVSKEKDRDILIESELGFIGKSSKLLDSVPEGAISSVEQMTKVDDATYFVKETGVDLLAPAVGNIHGIVKGGDPALNPMRVKEIFEALGIPLVLHGASGNTDSDIRDSIKSGIAMVHVNTELRVAYKSGLKKSLMDNPEEVAPYKYLKPAKLAMQRVVEEKLKLFNS
jgi:fructose-bisphosphate aldolase class II